MRVLKYTKLSIGPSGSSMTGAPKTQETTASEWSTPQVTRTSLSSSWLTSSDPRSTPTNFPPSTIGGQPSNITYGSPDTPPGGVTSPKIIAGSVVGGVLFVLLIGACAILYRRKVRARSQGILATFGKYRYFLNSLL